MCRRDDEDWLRVWREGGRGKRGVRIEGGEVSGQSRGQAWVMGRFLLRFEDDLEDDVCMSEVRREMSVDVLGGRGMEGVEGVEWGNGGVGTRGLRGMGKGIAAGGMGG